MREKENRQKQECDQKKIQLRTNKWGNIERWRERDIERDREREKERERKREKERDRQRERERERKRYGGTERGIHEHHQDSHYHYHP